jgi:hypothetical protein
MSGWHCDRAGLVSFAEGVSRWHARVVAYVLIPDHVPAVRLTSGRFPSAKACR